MRFLSVLLLFGGYMLVYAAVANHGRFATEPWAGLYADAYGVSHPSTPKQQPSQPNTGIPRPPITGVGHGRGGTRGVPGGRP